MSRIRFLVVVGFAVLSVPASGQGGRSSPLSDRLVYFGTYTSEKSNDPPFAAVQPGAGPRHFAFHPHARFAYVINEIDVTLTAFRSDPQRGGLTALQTVSTLPGGQTVAASIQVGRTCS
jgi:6-phosphogluconolactonase (cycloisomerase 2 family)